SKRFYPTRETWLANDPLTLSRSFAPSTGPALYLTCGRRDDWGCFVGNERLANNVANVGGEIVWVPREGGHCDIDYASLAAFLQQ
ncbi:MAG: esterase, partial [Pseudomonadota bacterium]